MYKVHKVRSNWEKSKKKEGDKNEQSKLRNDSQEVVKEKKRGSRYY